MTVHLNYLRDLYQYDDVKSTCNLDHIKKHYYRSHPWLNPSAIVPQGPILDFDAPPIVSRKRDRRLFPLC